MTLLGYSIPETLTDDAGNAQKGLTVGVTGPDDYTGSATTSTTTGILRLGPLPPGDYVITYGGRSAVVPVIASAEDIIAEVEVSSAVTSVAGRTGAVVLSSADLGDVSTLATDTEVSTAQAAAVLASQPRNHAWQASTAVKTGQILIHDGITYTVDSDHTTPASFVTTNLTVVGGVTGIVGHDDVVMTGEVSLAVADLSDGNTLMTTGAISDLIDTRVAASSYAALEIENVDTATYTFVLADRGKEKRFRNPAGCVATIPLGVFSVKDWFNVSASPLAGDVRIATSATASSITIPATAGNKHDTAGNALQITLPANIQAHDGILLASQVPIAKTMTPPTGFVADGAGNGLTGSGFSYLFKAVDIDTSVVVPSSTVSFTFGGTAVGGALTAMVLRGVDRTNFIDQSAGAAGASPGTHSAPSVTTGVAGTVEVSIVGRSGPDVGSGNSTAVSPPAGITKDVEALGASSLIKNNAITMGHGTLLGLAQGFTTTARDWTPAPSGSVYGNARTVTVKPYVAPGVELGSFDDAFTLSGPNATAQIVCTDPEYFRIDGNVKQ